MFANSILQLLGGDFSSTWLDVRRFLAGVSKLTSLYRWKHKDIHYVSLCMI